MMREYIAIVTDDNDPLGYNRAQVRIFELFPEGKISSQDLPWAVYRLPLLAQFNEGMFVSAKVGNKVWVDFPFPDCNGKPDTLRPRITGWVHECPDGLPNVPHETFGGPGSLDGMHERPSDPDIIEPEINIKRDTWSLAGTVFEFFKNSTFRITQRTSKTSIEIDKAGSGGFFSQSHLFLSARQKLKLIAGEIYLSATRLISLTVRALEIKLSNFVVESKGKMLLKGFGGTKLTGADLSLLASQGAITINASGLINESCAGASTESISIDPLLSPSLAKSIIVQGGGAELANLSITATGLYSVANQFSSLKDELLEIINNVNNLTKASKEVVIAGSCGPGKPNAASAGKYAQIEAQLAKEKAKLSLLLK